MVSKTVRPAGAVRPQNPLLRKAVVSLRATRWMSPINLLASKGSTVFGRSIESKLQEVRAGTVMRLQLRNSDAAVVMSVDRYSELLEMRALYSELLLRIQDVDTATDSDEYEELYQRISSGTSRAAADSLFSGSGKDLRTTFKPGRTESN